MGHLSALLRKNWLLWKRGGCGACLELCIPIAFTMLFFLMRSLTDKDTIKETAYYDPINRSKPHEQLPFQIYADIPTAVITGDGIIDFEDDVTSWQIPPIKNCLDKDEEGTGKIALAPRNDITEKLATYFEAYTMETKFFDDRKDLYDYYTREGYDEDICLGITFDKSGVDNKYKYRIHYNATFERGDGDAPNTLEEEVINYEIETIDEYINGWYWNGFLTIQNWVDNIILRQELGDDTASISSLLTSQRIQKHVSDELFSVMKGNFPTYTILPLIIVFCRFLYSLLQEKEQKIRESMKIMGLTDTSFYLSWIIYYGVIYFVISLITTIVCKATVFPNSDFLLILIWYYLFCLNVIFQALIVTTFFTRAKTGNICGFVIYMGFYILSLVITGNPQTETGTRALMALMPQCGLTQGADVFILIETKGVGIGWGDLGLIIDKFSVGISLYMSIISLVVQIIVFLYLDQVIPNEFGSKKHPLFCFPCFMRNRQKKIDDQNQKIAANNHDLENNKNVEPVTQFWKSKEENGQALLMKGLTKVYPNGKKAVDNLSLTMYQDHISCFLGHNGSGKTSTISMLSGMQDISSGTASAFGLDVASQMPELRKIMGVCPQHDILFGTLTVQEHLEVFAQLKGMTDKEAIAKEVKQLMDDVDLTFKKDALSKTLSGGQKRRLSVAMAFIGGSKLIYLDEPTSGCDTSVRRHIWEMLKKYKQDRIIVLTTHFMDEADYLGDRISIIGSGKLICSGSSDFLKTEFGYGYNLTIVKDNPVDPSQPIIDVVKKHIPSAIKMSDISAEIAFQLKMDEVSKFQGLLDEFDGNKQGLKISNYGISITTMEEVFLKVAEIEAEELANKEHPGLMKQSTLKNQSALQQEKGEFDNFDLNKVRIQGKAKIFFGHFVALVMKRVNFFKRDKKGLFCEVIFPCVLTTVLLAIITAQSWPVPPAVVFKSDTYDKKMPTKYAGSVDATTSEMDDILDGFTDDFKFEYVDSIDVEDLDKAHFDDRSEDRKGAYYFYDINNNNVEYLTEVMSNNRDAAPLFINQMNQAILRQQTGKPNLELTLVAAPFDYTAKFQSIQTGTKGIDTAFTFAMVLSFIPASLITFIVKERSDQIKHQQIISGISLQAYWTANYFIDIVKYIFPVWTWIIAMIYAYDMTWYTDEGEVVGAVILLLLLYGVAIIPFSYVFGFLFKAHGNAQVLSFFMHYIFGGIVPMVLWILNTFIESTRDYIGVIQWFCRYIPSFSLGYGLINIASRETFKIFFDDIEEILSPYHIKIAGGDMHFLLWGAVFNFGLIFVVEYFKSKGTVDKLIAKGTGYPQYTQKLYDDDVQKERDVVAQSSFQDYVIRLNQVRKVFKQENTGKYLEAVDSCSIGIKAGECFALLGVNGAGKTTLFKILSGDHLSTSGEAHINGYNVSTDMETARYNIGYCPQFDALLENLTTKEHLELYAAIKGIPKEMRQKLIDQKIEEMDLTKYRDVPAGTYSGGNKRKLSVAIAMIGNPPVVLLDEPSTGMDPKARRYMWDVISRISTKRKSSSIILTTHSMEEAEALSTKMCIMVQGNFKCLGSIQHIKSKFGRGYEIEIKVKLPAEEVLAQKVNGTSLQLQQSIKPEQLQVTLQQLGWEGYAGLIQPGQSAQELYVQLQSAKGLTIQHLIEFILVEESSVKIQNHIGQTFGKYSVIEHFGAFTRYKIETEVSTGKIFGSFEEAKKNLPIDYYSVKQATIEAIFNQFAINAIKTEDFNKGGQFYINQEQLRRESKRQEMVKQASVIREEPILNMPQQQLQQQQQEQQSPQVVDEGEKQNLKQTLENQALQTDQIKVGSKEGSRKNMN